MEGPRVQKHGILVRTGFLTGQSGAGAQEGFFELGRRKIRKFRPDRLDYRL
jgi:hypothetical protein